MDRRVSAPTSPYELLYDDDHFHDAVAGFTPPPGARWQVLMPADGDEIIAHHDLAPWNLVMGDGQWAFIDWDTAAPGTRLWDLAYAMHGFAPLSADPAVQQSWPLEFNMREHVQGVAGASGARRTRGASAPIEPNASADALEAARRQIGIVLQEPALCSAAAFPLSGQNKL